MFSFESFAWNKKNSLDGLSSSCWHYPTTQAQLNTHCRRDQGTLGSHKHTPQRVAVAHPTGTHSPIAAI